MASSDENTPMRFGTFYPTGYVVAVVDDAVHADQARIAIQQAGVPDVHVYAGADVVAHHQALLDQRTPLQRLGSVISADEKLMQEDYLEQARAGKVLLTVQVVPDVEQIEIVRRILRAQHAVLLRYYDTDGVVELSP